MKLNKFAPQKNAAQAIVEFAIVLPILLVLLYGLLEAGRLLFMYSSIVTASRQAVRYGATTGDGSTVGIPRYQDCTGIRLAANRTDYLNAFDHTSADVQIAWDTGPGTTQTSICAPGTPSQSWTPVGNNTRLVVVVTGHFNPIVRLVPFRQRDIVSTSRRTILVSVTIAVDDTTETPTFNIEHAPNPSDVGQTVPVLVTLSGTSGVPTGTVDILVDGTVVCDDLPLDAGGRALCNINFYTDGNITVDYTSTSANYDSATSGSVFHDVGPARVEITIVDSPSITKPGEVVGVTITVRNYYDPNGLTIIPSGTVTVTNTEGGTCGTLTLDIDGKATCTMTFNVEGTPIITASYSGDVNHDPDTGNEAHQVLLADPTVAPTVAPTAGPTAIVPTVAPTPVTNCNTIRDAIGAISFSTNTMSLNIPNGNVYPVTISSIYVAWNYDKGHIGSNSNLKLMSAKLNSTTIWQVTTGIHQPNYTIPLATSVVIPASGTSQLTFTFDQTYNRQSGEQIQIQFSTPGCELFPILVPVSASTPIPPANLKVQLISGGTDDSTQTQFRYQLQNNGSSAASNISVRIYFTLDGSNAASSYVLEKYWDQSGVATVSTPTRVGSTNVYYFTISYGSASLAAGGVWEFQTNLHLSSWASTYSSTNDWWHGTGTLPTSYTDWPTIPVYVSSSLIWGSPP